MYEKNIKVVLYSKETLEYLSDLSAKETHETLSVGHAYEDLDTGSVTFTDEEGRERPLSIRLYYRENRFGKVEEHKDRLIRLVVSFSPAIHFSDVEEKVLDAVEQTANVYGLISRTHV